MARTSLHWFTALASIALAGNTVVACKVTADPQAAEAGGSDGNPGGGGAPGAPADDDDDGFVGDGMGAPDGCDPPCAALEVCSVADQCIDPGTCLADGDCLEGTVCDEATMACVPGGGCGGKEAKAAPVAPNMLIVLDRSCSMTEPLGGGQNKWEVAVAAINAMTSSFEGKVRFGLTLFPDLDGPECEQGTIPIPVAEGNEEQIQTLLTGALQWGETYYPQGPCVTNIDTAMSQATTEPAFADKDRESYALLITDGQQNYGCDAGGGDAGTKATIADLLASKGVSTFVLGFGGEVDPETLSQFAEAGGVPAAGATKYHDAQDAASLESALAAIADKTMACTFALDEAPPDATEIYVFFDDTTTVPRDSAHVSGWDYDPVTQQVTFYGEHCEMLKAGEVTDVDIVFGCAEPVAD